MANKFITRKELALSLGCSPQTIKRWEKKDKGFPVYKFANKHPRYIYEEVEEYFVGTANKDVS